VRDSNLAQNSGPPLFTKPDGKVKRLATAAKRDIWRLGLRQGRAGHADPLGGAEGPQDMTNESVRIHVFNALEQAPWFGGLPGARVLDLFAGAGALGFEALARGAAFALFVETDAAARGAIRDEIEARGLFGITRIHRRDATDLGVKPAGLGDPFDLVFIDPPDADLGERALARLGEGGWIRRDATIVLIGGGMDDASPEFEVLDRSAGTLTFLRPK
jgi:16S rRNA (guanine966-N2)-methyltransferase